MSNSIGDLKNSGLQGNNFPWQLKMLEGLQKIYDEVLIIIADPSAIFFLLSRPLDSFEGSLCFSSSG
jgi:hypothetical protein